MRFLVSSLWSQMRFLVNLGSRGKQSCTVLHVLLTATTTCRDEEEASAVSLVSVWNCFSFLFLVLATVSILLFFHTCFRFGGCLPSFSVTRCFLCPLFQIGNFSSYQPSGHCAHSSGMVWSGLPLLHARGGAGQADRSVTSLPAEQPAAACLCRSVSSLCQP